MIYNNFAYILNKKTSNAIIIWIQFLIISLLLFLNVAFNYEYDLIDKYFGYVKNDSIVIYVKEENINNLSNLYILDKKYDFKIKSISEGYYLVDQDKYLEVSLDTPLEEKINIENNVLNIEFHYAKTTIYEEIKKGMKKWIE